MPLLLKEDCKDILASNVIAGMVDLHQQCTGLSAASLDAAKDSHWLDVRNMNAILFRFQYVYGAGTGLSFYVQESPDNGTTVFPYPIATNTLTSGANVIAGNITNQFVITLSAANHNFELAIKDLNAAYIRLATITAAGSPTTADKITVTARVKTFVG